MTKHTKDDALIALLKLALDFNSSIVTIATLHAGNMSKMKRSQQVRVYKDIERVYDEYKTGHLEIIGNMEKDEE